jgi:hypothetical protein
VTRIVIAEWSAESIQVSPSRAMQFSPFISSARPGQRMVNQEHYCSGRSACAVCEQDPLLLNLGSSSPARFGLG